MSRIFINGLSAKAGGGKSILINYLRLLNQKKTNNLYIVLVPNSKSFKIFVKKNVRLFCLPYIFSTIYFFPIVYSFIIPSILKRLRIDLVFNLADVPIRTNIKQIFLFDWAYAVYPKSEVWQKMDFKDLLIKKMKLYFFNLFSPFISTLIAQTETNKELLAKYYSVCDIQVVPNAVSLDNHLGGENKNFNLPKGIKLLYLTHYYSHKNIEIFLNLAKKIKTKNLIYKLVVTLNPNQHPAVHKFFEEVDKYELREIIINVGAVNMNHVPSLYQQCDGLLMPTLLESFSGTYVEAMYHRIPIFTSNLNFAKDVCKNAAIYFDPYDDEEILQKLQLVFNSPILKEELIKNGIRILNQYPDWNKVFEMYNNIIEKEL